MGGTDVIVLDSVAWSDHLDILEALDGPDQLHLSLLGEAIVEALRVHYIAVDALGL